MVDSAASSTSSSLLERARRRDAQAWRRLSDLYGPLVYGWARNAGLQRADAADVLQEVFQAVAIHLDRFRRDRPGDTFRGWLWTIFRSKLMDYYRRRRSEPVATGDEAAQLMTEATLCEPNHPASSAAEAESAQLVRRALQIIKQDFSERTWEAFWRCAVADEPPGAVARDLKMTPAAVCMCRARVLRRLRETLAGMGHLPGD